jgi:hypothetical protein
MKCFGVGDKLKQKAFFEDIRYFATAIKKIDVLAGVSSVCQVN